jgi:hypothetical protein
MRKLSRRGHGMSWATLAEPVYGLPPWSRSRSTWYCLFSRCDIYRSGTAPVLLGSVTNKALGLLINRTPTVRTDGSINGLARAGSYENFAVAAHLSAFW